MAITLTHYPLQFDKSGNCETVKIGFALSGSYSAGGETVDLTIVPRLKVRDKLKIRQVWFVSTNGVFGYTWVPGSTLANGKIKILTALATELGAGAYAAGYTGDAPLMFVEVMKA